MTVKVEIEEMNIPGRFILLMAANIFLSGDYEYCLWICSHDFSYVATTSLFKGNILRFKSLAAEQLFFHMNLKELVEDDDNKFLTVKSPTSSGSNYRDLSNLFLAVDSAQQALNTYRQRIQRKVNINHYGMAL